jgi:hypothetical protein
MQRLIVFVAWQSLLLYAQEHSADKRGMKQWFGNSFLDFLRP